MRKRVWNEDPRREMIAADIGLLPGCPLWYDPVFWAMGIKRSRKGLPGKKGTGFLAHRTVRSVINEQAMLDRLHGMRGAVVRG